MVEHARDALHDREAKAQPARHLGAFVEPLKFAEDHALLGLRDAEPGVENVDPQPSVAASAADQDTALRRVLHGVGDEILQQAPQQPAVRAHAERAWHEGEVEAFRAREWRELELQLAQQFFDAEVGEFRPHGAGIEPRNVEQRPEDFFDRVERGIDIADQPCPLAIGTALPLDQRGHVQTGGVQRLQDVVAGGGEEPRLGDVGLLGVGLGANELGVQAGEFGGALANPHLERCIGTLERFGGCHARRDVGDGGDDAAVRHAVGADLDHKAAILETLEERLSVERDVVANALAHQRIDLARAKRALICAAPHDLLKGRADPRELGRQVEDFAELAVPAHQTQVLVVDRDTLANVVERRLQDLAVVVDRGIGVVEQLQRGLGGDRLLAQQQRQHEPRRGRADRRGKLVLGVAQQFEIGLGRRFKADAARGRKALETTRACAPRRGSARLSRSVPRPSRPSARAGSSD